MSNKLQPISFYVNDREEMINQMFSTVKEDKLRAMLPPILKGLPLAELKSSCLEELLGISSKRIKSILVGRELLSSSDSEDLELSGSDENAIDLSTVESDSNDDNSALGPSHNVRSEDALQIAMSPEEIDDVLEGSDSPKSKTKHHKKAQTTAAKLNKLKRPHPEPGPTPQLKSTKLKTKSSATNGHLPVTEEAVPANGRTLLEIVELELRARAIRAALTHQEKILDHREAKNTGITIEIKEESTVVCTNSNIADSSIPGPSKDLEKHSKSKEKTSQSNEKEKVKKPSRREENESKDDDSIEIVCEDISSDEDAFNDVEDAGEEPELIEPVVESIVISSDSEPEKEVEKQQSSWKERWLEKKDIASVMKASKLITNVKRKMKHNKTKKIAAQVVKDQESVSTPQQGTIQGTVSEFNCLTSSTSPSVEVTQTPKDPATGLQPTSEPPPQIEEATSRELSEHIPEQKRDNTENKDSDNDGLISETLVNQDPCQTTRLVESPDTTLAVNVASSSTVSKIDQSQTMIDKQQEEQRHDDGRPELGNQVETSNCSELGSFIVQKSSEECVEDDLSQKNQQSTVIG